MFFGRSDHCHQWFYDGFLMLLPSLSMVFDGSGPLAKRCDGFDGSLWSNVDLERVGEEMGRGKRKRKATNYADSDEDNEEAWRLLTWGWCGGYVQ